jgi:predicted nucleotidyltransferase
MAAALGGADGVVCAFIFGSLAAHSERPDSDVDLFVVGSIEGRELSARTSRLSDQALGRVLNTVHYTEAEINARVRARNHFVLSVLSGPKMFVIGGEEQLARFKDLPAR